MNLPLDTASASYAESVRTLERCLADTRPQWNDSARIKFDHQYAEPLITHARRTAADLSQLAQELNAAARLLKDPS
jgi:hypothetical protein